MPLMNLPFKIQILQAVRVLLATVVTLVLLGCSSQSRLVVTPVPLPVTGNDQEGSRMLDSDWEFLSEQGEALLYRSSGVPSDSNHIAHPLFLTSLRACGGKNNSRKLRSTSRQLLVGFDKLRILSQVEVSLADLRALRTYATASIDKSEVGIAVTTIVTPSCSLDLVLWSELPHQEAEPVEFLKVPLTNLELELSANNAAKLHSLLKKNSRL